MQTALFIFIKRKWDADKQLFTRFVEYYSRIGKRTLVRSAASTAFWSEA